ncbi:MAG TPA: FCD domain-containing protein [Nocardioidaceae bacterium]|nr:FCD domain-containing protein [Nocardioidaceae bacterium]
MAERLSKSITDELLARISRGDFGPGDQLPTETELMVEYGVGRNTVREAMQALRALGIVEIRPRLGARVLESAGENVLATSAISRLLRDGTVDELYDVRLVLEPAAAERAARNRSEEDLLAIKRALTHFRVAYEMGENVFEADIAFHAAIAQASGNSMLARILSPMADVLAEARRATGTLPEAVELALHEHDLIAAAIEAKSARSARAAMTTHIKSGIWAINELKKRDDV